MKKRIRQPEYTRPSSGIAGQKLGEKLRFLYRRILRVAEARPRQLRLVEMLSLGERRFVAVVEYNASRFLLGGTPGSLELLAELGTGQQHAGSDHNKPLDAEIEVAR